MHQFFCFCFIRATLLHLVPHDLNGIVNRVRAIRYMQKRSKRNQPPSANSAYAGLDRATGAFLFTYEPRSRAIDSAESFRNVVCVCCAVCNVQKHSVHIDPDFTLLFFMCILFYVCEGIAIQMFRFPKMRIFNEYIILSSTMTIW